MKQNIILEKSYDFAVRIIKMYQWILENRNEYTLVKQVLRSGTSIGANVEEAVAAQSDKDFLAKLYISLKEAKETYYWLRLLHDTNYMDEKQFRSIANDCDELIRLLVSIIKTKKQNMKN